MRIHVIRHGEAGDDIEDAYGGAANFRLTDLGRAQAAAVADTLRGSAVERIFTSPLARASESAEILSASLPHEPAITVVPELRERNSYGVMSGVSKAKAKELFDYILSDLQEKPGYSREPLLGAEDFDQFVLRVRAAFDAVIHEATQSGAAEVAIVTHGKFTQALCEHVLRFDEAVDLDFSKVLSFEYSPAHASLVGPAA